MTIFPVINPKKAGYCCRKHNKECLGFDRKLGTIGGKPYTVTDEIRKAAENYVKFYDGHKRLFVCYTENPKFAKHSEVLLERIRSNEQGCLPWDMIGTVNKKKYNYYSPLGAIH